MVQRITLAPQGPEFPRFVCANFAQQTLSAEAKHVLLLCIAKVLPVKPLVTGTHTPTAIAAFINLTNPPARALDGEKFQLLCHTHLHKSTITYSEDVMRLLCKRFTTVLWH